MGYHIIVWSDFRDRLIPWWLKKSTSDEKTNSFAWLFLFTASYLKAHGKSLNRHIHT